MDKNETIEFILSVMPKAKHFIKVATDEELQNLKTQAKEKMKMELTEACY